MIVEQKTREFEQSDVNAQSFAFGIDDEDLPHIASLLEDKTYKDKQLAVIREYSTNAYDAHVEAGIPNRPFFVQLPTDFEPIFKVRDYGFGLPEEKLRTIFTRYGKSTKRTSNSMVGCLGLGCKSGFAYANSFMVVSINGGKKFVYNAVKDDKGLNRLVKLGEEDTNEPSGVEIAIPVAENDFDTFRQKALDLYRWFRIMPEIHGVTDGEKEILIQKREILAQGTGWVLYNSGEPRAIMGNIGYTLESYSLNTDYRVRQLLNLGFEMEFDIGELDIVMSREGLEYTDKTRKAIQARAEVILNELQGVMQARFDQCANYWEAKCLFGTIYNSSTNDVYYHIREFVKKEFNWKGTPVTSDTVDTNDVSCMRVFTSRGKVKLGERDALVARPKTLCIINDINSLRGAKNRLAPVIAQPDNEWTFLFSFKDDAEKDKFITDNHLETLTFRKLSEYPYNRVPRVNNPNAKHLAKTFVLDSESGCHEANSGYWTPEDIDIDAGGIYVSLNRFESSIFGRPTGSSELVSLLELAETFGVSVDDVYGFKESYLDKKPLPANWISLDKYIQEELNKEFHKRGLHQKWVDYAAVESFRECGLLSKDILDFVGETKFEKQDGVAAQLSYAFDEMSEASDQIKSARRLATFFNCAQLDGVTPTFDLTNLAQEFIAKYPMLHLVSHYHFRNYYPESRKKITEYIDSIDKL